MSQHRKLASSGFVLFLAATQVGCAGSGLKNLFTRNETDGYHSIDELEAEERRLAKAEESGYEDESPSITTRIASWRPFGKPEINEEEEYAANESDTSATDSEEHAKSSNILSRAFAKRDTVDADPFLETDSITTKQSTPVTVKSAPNRELAKLDEMSATAKRKDKSAVFENEFAMTAEPKAKPEKEASVVTNKTLAKSDSAIKNPDDADALARRFEQHFLLNSTGTVAKAETEDFVASNSETLQKKATAIVANTDAKQRDITSIAEKQIDAFDYLLGSDSSNSERTSSSRSKPAAEPVNAARRRDVREETSVNSLAAFESLIGVESNNTKHPVIEAAHTVTQEFQHKSAAVDIEVADAEALFGAAAARQNAREKQPATVRTALTSNIDDTNSEFHWNETQSEISVFEGGNSHADATGTFVSQRQQNGSSENELFHSSVFGTPPVTAGNIKAEVGSVVDTAATRMPVKTAFASHSQDGTTRSNRNQSNAVILPAALESSPEGEVRFTAAPVAPVSELESTDRVAPAANRPGLVQSLSARNWLLLIGGIVVIALLFAPGRTKPATMTGRTANG